MPGFEPWCDGNEDPATIKKKFEIIYAVRLDDVDLLENHQDFPKWYNVRNQLGNSLLQIAILEKRFKVFNYLISIPDIPLEHENEEGETALVVALGGSVHYAKSSYLPEHFSYELLKKGACVDVICSEDNTPLHCAITHSYPRVLNFLIEKGVDVNVCNDSGKTPLQLASSRWLNDEVVTTLLIHGAVPSTDVFEKSIFHRPRHLQLHEFLFLNIFDEYSDQEISLDAIVQLAIIESPLFHDLVKHHFRVYIRDDEIHTCFKNLCSISLCYLKIIIENFENHVRRVINLVISDCENIFFDWQIENLNLMLESELKPDVIELLATAPSESLIWFLQQYKSSAMTEVYCFYLSYGLNITEGHLLRWYRKYGYCELFQILLHMDIEIYMDRYKKNIIPALFYDMSLDFEQEFESPQEFKFSQWQTKGLMAYFGHPVLRQMHLRLTDDRTENPPPLLIELARNAFRKYFIELFQIRTSRRFYTLLNKLPINNVYKKIISYETKLYPDFFVK